MLTRRQSNLKNKKPSLEELTGLTPSALSPKRGVLALYLDP